MKRNTSIPLYELRLSAIGTIESHSTAVCVGIRSPTRLLATGASESMKGPGRIPATRQRAAKMNIAVSDHLCASRARSAASVRGRPRKVTLNALTKQAAASGGERQQTANSSHEELQSPGRQLRAQQNRLERQPAARSRCGGGLALSILANPRRGSCPRDEQCFSQVPG